MTENITIKFFLVLDTVLFAIRVSKGINAFLDNQFFRVFSAATVEDMLLRDTIAQQSILAPFPSMYTSTGFLFSCLISSSVDKTPRIQSMQRHQNARLRLPDDSLFIGESLS